MQPYIFMRRDENLIFPPPVGPSHSQPHHFSFPLFSIPIFQLRSLLSWFFFKAQSFMVLNELQQRRLVLYLGLDLVTEDEWKVLNYYGFVYKRIKWNHNAPPPPPPPISTDTTQLPVMNNILGNVTCYTNYIC